MDVARGDVLGCGVEVGSPGPGVAGSGEAGTGVPVSGADADGIVGCTGRANPASADGRYLWDCAASTVAEAPTAKSTNESDTNRFRST